MFRYSLIIAFVALLPILQLSAQQPTLERGAQVRVHAHSGQQTPLVGTIVEADSQSMLVLTDTSHVQIDFSSISRLEMSSTGMRTSRVLKRGGVGLLVGVAGGALVGPLFLSTDCWGSFVDPGKFGGCMDDFTSGSNRLRATGVFGVAGGIVGALVGALLERGERWQEIPIGQLRIGIAPDRNRLALGISVGF